VLSESTENYLTALLRLEEAGEAATTTVLARRLDVAPASVTGMLKKLADADLVTHRRYRGATLTPRGRRAAGAVLRRHRLVETFLVRALGFPRERVHAEAHRWEHAVSEEAVERIDSWLGHPRRDPHGAAIPPGAGRSPREYRLAALEAGAAATVAAVAGIDAAHADYLRGLGLVTGAALRVVERRPFGGPVTLDVGGHRCIVGPEVTAHVTVREEIET
jgi:DtxR family Mn-dependent transcriptional regulator